MEKIGERIRKVRKQRGLSPLQLSYRAYCSDQTVTAIESGKQSPHPDDIKWFAIGLGVSEKELTKGTDWEVKA